MMIPLERRAEANIVPPETQINTRHKDGLSITRFPPQQRFIATQRFRGGDVYFRAEIIMEAQTPEPRRPRSKEELEELEGPYFLKFGFRQCVAWVVLLLGVLFAVMSVGCIIQHFVDEYMPWGKDVVRDIVEPSHWAACSILMILAARALFRKKYWRAITMFFLFAAAFAVTGSIFGFE